MKKTEMDLLQKRTPYIDAYKEYLSEHNVAFDVPGHHQGNIRTDFDKIFPHAVYKNDINCPRGLDNILHPNGVIKEAEELFALATGARKARFLINGSTSGILIMLMATLKAHQKIILPRNVHKSVINGLDKVNKLREQYNNGELDYDLPEDMFLFGINLENIIHLLDDYTFPIVMKELDTISDFINFFQKKEEFLKSQKFPVGILDLDLLPIYLLDIDPMTCCFSFKQLETMSNQYDTVLFGNTVDPYPDFCKEEYYKNLKKDLKSSYLWDYLIDSCAQDALDDLLVEQQDINDTNKTLKIMAEEPRLSRKYISEAYLETIDTFNNNASHRGRAVQSPYNKEIMYVFLQVKRQDGEDYTDYRKRRRAFATVYCNVINANHPCIKYVVAIVSEPVKYNLYLSRDFILYPCEPLSDEEKKNILKIQKDLNVLQITRNMKSKDTHTSKVGRNDKCPCGSGLKYKKCCLNK